MNYLQKALRLNAIFSSTSGITLLLYSNQIDDIFETNNPRVFQIIGLLLLFFTITIVYEIFKQRPIAVLWIIVQDFLWVLGSFIIIVFNPFEISKSGNSTIATIAFVVLFMGVNQTKALAQVDNGTEEGRKQLIYERNINATKQEVWKVISDVANYDKFAPNIDNVNIVSGKGQGMVRSCSHGEDSWTETCSMWIEEQSYSFIVDTSAPNYPYPFIKYLQGTWEVQEIDTNTTKIIMYFDLQYKHKYQNVFLHPILKGKFKKVVNKLLGNWQSILEKK